MADSTKYTSKLASARALIIGGTSGLGFAAAEALIEQGAYVTISSSSATRVSAAITKLQAAYPSATSRIAGQTCDLSDAATCEARIATLFEQAGALDHVLFTAGDALTVGPLDGVDMAQMLRAGQIRFFAPLLVAKHAARVLPKTPASSLTLTTGSVSERPLPGWVVVGSYATGLHGMTRSLALEMAPVRVNCVSPGVVATEMWAHMGDQAWEGMQRESEKKMMTGKVPGPEEVAESYLYLVRDRNVTGTVVSTNGGVLLK